MVPYHKNKQQAFQAAQQGFQQALDANDNRVKTIGKAEYGKELAHLTQEMNEAFVQINKALEVASEHQYNQLKQYEQDLMTIQNEMDQ
ncbi:hypothetical protein [Pontibacillus litoralis]|uniref:Small, acid-soluble spore protein N n=1 Tax=Pontibacillus litoralis JSM 072002 TaxID=1385512 RepID=A0A0A5G8Y3_9BACI|nr:hypothetical protein [Pontibacillus litoralis]KGX87560.1 hypothetical protein N784_15040 [Pontibacillus litoralis JSM 072002]